MNENEVWYFAYGSNLNIGQMINRIGEWIRTERAVLWRHRLVFNVKSKRWGGLTANILKTGSTNDRVYGVLYQILKEKLNVLTIYEGISPEDKMVETDKGQLPAKVYIFNTTRKPGRPPSIYLNMMLSGLKQHGYTEEIIKEVRRTAISYERLS